jgi:hypothetical protein
MRKPLISKRPIPKGRYRDVQVGADTRDLAVGKALIRAQRLDRVIDLARRRAA